MAVEETTKIMQELGYIKLYRNSKNYTWEIKMHEGKTAKDFEILLAQIEILNNAMLNKFGSID